MISVSAGTAHQPGYLAVTQCFVFWRLLAQFQFGLTLRLISLGEDLIVARTYGADVYMPRAMTHRGRALKLISTRNVNIFSDRNGGWR